MSLDRTVSTGYQTTLTLSTLRELMEATEQWHGDTHVDVSTMEGDRPYEPSSTKVSVSFDAREQARLAQTAPSRGGSQGADTDVRDFSNRTR